MTDKRHVATATVPVFKPVLMDSGILSKLCTVCAQQIKQYADQIQNAGIL